MSQDVNFFLFSTSYFYLFIYFLQGELYWMEWIKFHSIYFTLAKCKWLRMVFKKIRISTVQLEVTCTELNCRNLNYVYCTFLVVIEYTGWVFIFLGQWKIKIKEQPQDTNWRKIAKRWPQECTCTAFLHHEEFSDVIWRVLNSP